MSTNKQKNEQEQLVYIEVSKIDPHPDNPRKELGDISELVESIRANGILQNLTVVPWFSTITRAPADGGTMDGYYRALIGHRRLAAAKLAGLEKVPCVVANVSPKEQLQIMLQENMQRSDLTVYEQAKGFQMMLNLGDTVESLAKRSGFSQSTIRRRVKLLELDEKELRAAEGRGATLADYMELEKLESQEEKNKVLQSVGTENFRYHLKQALEREKDRKKKDRWREVLSQTADEVDGTAGYKTERVFSISNDPTKWEVPADANTRRYYFHITSWGTICLMVERPNEDANEETEQLRIEKELARQQEEEQRAKRNATTKMAYELRAEFADNVSTATIKKHLPELIAHWLLKESSDSTYINEDDVAELFDFMEGEDGYTDYADVLGKVSHNPEWALWQMIWYCLGDDETNGYFCWDGTYESNKHLDSLYDLLTVLGYEMSDEEQALSEGTHDLFRTKGGVVNA